MLELEELGLNLNELSLKPRYLGREGLLFREGYNLLVKIFAPLLHFFQLTNDLFHAFLLAVLELVVVLNFEGLVRGQRGTVVLKYLANNP